MLALGRFLGTAHMDPGPGVVNLITTGGTAYVQKLGSGNTSLAEQASTAPALYPNPTRNTITVQHLEPRTRLQLLNAQGATVREWQALDTTTVLHLHDLAPGTYLLRMQSEKRVEVVRVVKE